MLNLWRASYGEEEDVSETYAGHQVMVKTLVAWWLMGRTYGGAFGGPMVEPLKNQGNYGGLTVEPGQ